jgi:hypothetical protein
MASDQQEAPSGIKRLEKRKGRLWGFLRREDPGVVTPLSSDRMTRRLRNLIMYSTKTMGSFLRSRMGERGLTSLFEHQAEEFASSWRKSLYGADKLARDTIMYNFQPLGIEAVYSGDREVAQIVVEECPLPQRLMRQPEFLEEITFVEKSLLSSSDFAGDNLTAKGEWPPKKLESCSVCRIVMPRIGERLGFEWEIGMTKAIPRRCLFTIRVSPK